ncbi:proline dehydrogenase family protein [Planomicrobium sp. CPCC 101110]|uniref:proline dehydrogenase family protein n=1 Tax=Planomicrobium sp. CPCC 101110 TaxID=2599619 RepID=UPI0011B5D0DA|nr:proline dehydrogenase family protein [Planomicrobium sp. CPCC 101110]TWT24806.1 proline dehydrogenase [Planomicrobium sp. CPCC 101110]
MLKEIFIGLSTNQMLTAAAKKYGLKLGAQNVVAGTNVEETIKSIRELNALGISCTVDNLGEFVFEREEALKAKDSILEVIEAIHANGVDAHISLKPTQIGLDIDYDFCYESLKEIVAAASKYDMHINLDMEDYGHVQPSYDLLETLLEEYSNVGTVIQSYFYRAQEDIEKHKDLRLRIVKGAYKEPAEYAYQTREEIDANFIKLIEYHLLNGKFTSIATHDHNIINHVIDFVEEHGISRDKFEFQMLYGFRKDMQVDLAKKGYNFCTYVPFGDDWYGYFMRRLAERPQNLNLVVKQVFNKRTNTAIGLFAGAYALGRLTAKKK